MTVAIQVPLVSAISAALQTVFPFNFRCDDSATLAIYVNDVLQGGGFTIALNVDQDATPGGTITFAAGRAAGDIVSIERQSPDQQGSDFSAYTRFPASVMETSLDKLIMLMQEVWALFGRVFRMKRSLASKIGSFEFNDTPVLGSVIGWKDAGGGLFKLGNITAMVSGELLTDSGDHTHFTSLHSPVGSGALYRNGQRVFPADDYAVAGNVWTMVNPLAAGEKLNADYSY